MWFPPTASSSSKPSRTTPNSPQRRDQPTGNYEKPSTTPRLEDWALWAAVLDARGRRLRKGNRGRDSGGVSRYWDVVPTYSQQLIQAIRDHAELTPGSRPADRQLREIINNPRSALRCSGLACGGRKNHRVSICTVGDAIHVSGW